MDIERIRLIAEADRLMDDGKIPWVWSLGPYGQMERLSVAPEIMEVLELRQGQTVNSIVVNAIADLSLQLIKEKVDEAIQNLEDSLLRSDFDFRKEMDK